MSDPRKRTPGMMKETRIDRRFARLKAEGRAALVTFVTAGDPDHATSRAIVNGLPGAGADIIEIGMPFSDPMADGPAIQASSQRALKGGERVRKTLDLVRIFRETDDETPIVLMGYFNPIYVYPSEKFLGDAAAAGVDGLIIVDLPPEADDELCLPAMAHNINFIRLATPTTDEERLPAVLTNTSGFLYYVSIMGITGTRTPDLADVRARVEKIREKTHLPIAVGFGVKTPEQARQMAKISDGVVVGSALVNAAAATLDDTGKATDKTAPGVLKLVNELSQAIRGG